MTFVLAIGLSLLLSLSALVPSRAIPVAEVPNPRQQDSWVTDMADLLSPDSEAKLNQMITALEETNGAEIAVVTVPDTKPSASPKAFATELFNTWGIGKKGEDNGILFLVSKNERRTEIETGYGVESILPDAQVGNILRTQVTPSFKQGNFDVGIVNGTQAIIQVLESDTFEPKAPIEETTQPSTPSTPTERVQAEKTPWQTQAGFIALLMVMANRMLAYRAKITNQVFRIAPVGRTTLKSRRWVCFWINKLRNFAEDDVQKRLSRQGVVLNAVKVFQTWWLFYGVSTVLVLFAYLMQVEMLWYFCLAWVWFIYELLGCIRRDHCDTDIPPKLIEVHAMAFIVTLFGGGWLQMIHPYLPGLLALPFIIACAAALQLIRQLSEQGEVRCQCQSCDRPLQRLDDDTLYSYLNASEQNALEGKHAVYEGWQCPNCSSGPSTDGLALHLFSEQIPILKRWKFNQGGGGSSSSGSYSGGYSASNYSGGSDYGGSSGGSDFGGGSSGGGGAGDSW
ncbi:YgcG family protein [Acaryochloris sp. IP29b_bin.148]|uniref:TPM domain-containing protein n=1 Tax=Acaryochloris sp. IP29b_bin.148 TaxID=2969218 RepID=UPI00261B1DB1|nr:TPM domain-containing protein [Acaryochloris sp. IP29b_bin.148]